MKTHSKVPKEIIAFTSCSMVLTALGIDIMLPAFADLRRHFSIVEETAQTDKLISFFFMGQITQIIFGYLTDKMGRLPILRFGVILYIICGFATVYAPNIEWMFVLRFISGMGAAAVLMTSIASVRDQYAGDEMARIMSLVLALFLFTPVIAPALGAFVLKFYSWKCVFLIPPTFALIVLIWSFRIKESHPKEARIHLPIKDLLPKFKSIITDWHFLRYSIIATLLFAILSSYVSSSERIIGEIYNSPKLFPIIFGTIGLLMAILSLSNSFFTRKFGAKNTLRVILLMYLAVSALLVLVTFFIGNPPPMIYFFILIALLMAFTTAGDPNSSSIALEFMGENAGLAASVYGTIFFFIGSSIGAAISSQLSNGVLPLAISAFGLSALAVLLSFSDKTNKSSL
ncbi:MFS transporter [Emticicia aquatilis]|uniref:MFS transporter n=1 Tax=Emticicia aquatilis TaxID=1537369 RepID=A0A917DX85_9BACT|nr:MFS transporter [Emticicia aquatilis]GGD75377.1 MFS transporter [Emticicia aquatilis]